MAEIQASEATPSFGRLCPAMTNVRAAIRTTIVALAVLALVPDDRRTTLIAARKPGAGSAVYVLDVHLQGDQETVFFDV